MSEEVIKVLEYLGSQIGVTIDWSKENVLPFVQQIGERVVKWETSTSIAWIAIMFVILVIWMILGIWAFKSDDCEIVGIYIVMSVFIIATTLVVTGQQIFDIIECRTFPEKTIYEWAVGILNRR